MYYRYLGSTKKNIGMVNIQCRRYHGTGRLGFWGGQPVPCNCVRLIPKPNIWQKIIARIKRIFKSVNPVKWRKNHAY